MKIPIATVVAASIAVVCVYASATETNSNAGGSAVITAFGWQIAHEKEVNGIDISRSELTNFIAGFSLGVQDRKLPFEMRKISADVDALAKARQRKVVAAIKHRSAAEAGQFLAAWKKTAIVDELPDGVQFEIVRKGDAVFPRPMQTVRVHYLARLVNGSVLSEFGPDNLILETNHLDRGLFEGFQKIGVGGKIKLYLPPAFVEKEIEMAGAPHGSALVYEIEMLGATNTPADVLADALAPSAPDPSPPAYSGQFPTNEVVKAWGWEIAQRARLWRLSLDEKEIASLAKGFESGVRDEPFPGFEKIQPRVERFINGRKEKFQETFRQKQIAAMDALFTALDKNTNVVKLPDGLRYEILKSGTGAFPKPEQIVLVNYTGRTLDGNMFDQTANEPLHVQVGRVIPGWSEGIQKINRGGRIKLYIPPSLGYGDDAVSGIPADSTLIYDIELLGIEDAETN
ncbi:MAG TPA: FKBP-type peptidyl-prolyl cis-trans isomerase [Verrucomicrobiae bacterium]|nr:FKBP-type peptidyl-prolyl cis-trans isomerase [Verrucomicrobiae bacterium]